MVARQALGHLSLIICTYKLKEERFVLALSLRGFSVWSAGSNAQFDRKAWRRRAVQRGRPEAERQQERSLTAQKARSLSMCVSSHLPKSHLWK